MPLQRVHGDRILTLPIEQGSTVPVYRQVYLGVRQAILAGKVSPRLATALDARPRVGSRRLAQHRRDGLRAAAR